MLGCALLGALAVGCGSPATAEESAAPAADFDGVYLPTSAGEIAGMEFHGSAYTLVPEGCAAASCEETGSYSVDPARTRLTLVATKGQSREIPLQVVKTEPASDGTKPQGDLVSSGQQTVTGGAQTVQTGQDTGKFGASVTDPGHVMSRILMFQGGSQVFERQAKILTDGTQGY